MGAKDSKPCCITYEEAVKRVTDAELKRLKEAFKRVSTLNGSIAKQSFLKDVIGEGVPSAVGEYIFIASGGTQKGITLKDLLCGLVLLTRGKEDEKLKFLFCLYSNESGSYVVRDDFLRLLHVCENGYIPDSVASLFSEGGRASYDEFRDWLLSHPDATSLSRWLLADPCITLSNELETPTFYQTLAGVTHLEESDIIELEKRYWTLKGQSRTGKLDLETLIPLVSPPVPLTACPGVFAAFDENRDSHIDFKEMACGVSAACRGPTTERHKFCFKVFDSDGDGVLNKQELENMVEILLFVRHENKSEEELATDPFGQVDTATIIKEIRTHASGDVLTTEEYLMWAVSSPLPMDFLNLIFQVCHIVLGLRPVTREEEGSIVKGWLEREERRGYRVGQFWYLVAMDWWRTWQEYVSYRPGNESPLSSTPSSSSSPSSLTGSLKRSNRLSSRSRAQQNSLIEDCVAGETNSSVVFTGMSSLDKSSVKKASNNSLSLLPLESRPSSGTSSPSHSPRPPRKALIGPPVAPGPIDNSDLVASPAYKVMTLTGEGGKLKRNLVLMRWQDFELVPDSLWKALFQWYGGAPALPRQVILPVGDHQMELELYPPTLRLLRHTAPIRPAPPSASWAGVVGGYGATASAHALVSSLPQPPKRHLAYVAAFSRMATVKQVYDFLCSRLRLQPENMRLWHYRDESNMQLIEEEEPTLEELGIVDEDQLLIEVRNKDLTWPEEMGSLSIQLQDKRKQVPAEKGATGLNNLGNTCFMNAALQCVSNTRALTQYFTGNMHLFELNRTNPLGMKGHIAKRYGDLMHDIWSGTAKTIAPLKLRWTIGKYAPRFNGFQQHDSQELLAFLLDGLHEDLNRVHDKPYVELKDSDGRPDVEVAQEAWENHILRNKSIIVDLFHGQLKSKVTCKVCGHESVRFDPFNYLSLPLPMESYSHVQVIVIRLDGTLPVKYGLRLNMDEKYSSIKMALAPLCGIPAHLLRLSEVTAAQIKNVLPDDQKIRTLLSGALYAYQLPETGSFLTEEERSSLCSLRSQREAQTFTAIQRSIQPKTLGNATGINGSSTRLGSADESTPCRVAGEECWSAIQAGAGERESDGGAGEVLVNSSSSLAAEEVSPVSQLRQSSTNSSNASSASLAAMSDTEPSNTQHGFIVALHRKMIRQDVYFLSSQKDRPSLFGLPVIVPCGEATTHQDLYQAVWVQVARLVSPLPPSETAAPNHAQDCDDSLGYEFPFVLKAVQKDGSQCAWCPWYRFCRGCRIQCCDAEFNYSCSHLAIDWDPTALHLRYQTSQEKVCVEHESVALTRQQQSEPINLDYCLEAFTKEEHLGEDEKYYCSKCKLHQLASKKLQIWRLPPILIVHLKRFQFVNGKWVKSQKVVNFPFNDFDPTSYLASVPKETVLRHKEIQEGVVADILDEQTGPHRPLNGEHDAIQSAANIPRGDSIKTVNAKTVSGSEVVPTRNGVSLRLEALRRERLESTSLVRTPVVDGALQDFHQHRLVKDTDPFSLQFNLYSIVSHSGILGGGHYVSYACNPNGKWYCYNDSSCKEMGEGQMDTSSAYMLFYQRQGLCQAQYMPNVLGRTPDTRELDDEFDSDLKKLCTVM